MRHTTYQVNLNDSEHLKKTIGEYHILVVSFTIYTHWKPQECVKQRLSHASCVRSEGEQLSDKGSNLKFNIVRKFWYFIHSLLIRLNGFSVNFFLSPSNMKNDVHIITISTKWKMY